MKEALASTRTKRRPGRAPNKVPSAAIFEDGYNDVTNFRDFTLPPPPNSNDPYITIVNDPIQFWNWWLDELSFPPEGKKSFDWVKPNEDSAQTSPRYKVYFWRKLPLCDPGLIGEKVSYILRTHAWPFLTATADPEKNWKVGTLEAFGSGRFKVEIVDNLAGRSIANCEYEIWDWARYPPKINFDTLLMDAKENKQVIQIMRQQGIKLPGDKGYGSNANKQEEENEMAIAEKLLDRVLDEKAENGNGSNELVVEVMRTNGRLIEQALSKQQTNEQQASPLELMKAMADVFQPMLSMKNQGSDEGSMQKIQMLYDMQSRELDRVREDSQRREKSLRDEISDLRKLNGELQDKLAEARAKEHKECNIMDCAGKVDAMKAALGVTGRMRVEKAEPPTLLQELTPLLQPLIPMMVQGFMSSQAGQQAAQQTGQPTQQPQQPQPQTIVIQPQSVQSGPRYKTVQATGETQASQQTGASMPQPTQPPNQQVGVSAPASGISAEAVKRIGMEEATRMFGMYGMYLSTIAQPLVRFLIDPELHGEDFADSMEQMYGRDVYNQVRNIGQEDLFKAILTYAPIWDVVKGKITEEYLHEFVEHFVNSEKYFVDSEESEDASVEEAQTEEPVGIEEIKTEPATMEQKKRGKK